MESGSLAARFSGAHWRLWALLPIIALVGAIAIFVSTGNSLLDLVGQNPPPRDELDVRRVEFQPGQIKVKVTNPQREDITIATVTVDDAIVPYTLDGDRTIGRLRSTTVVIRTTTSLFSGNGKRPFCGKPGVSTNPGLIVCTEMPRAASSIAADRENASWACLVAE